MTKTQHKSAAQVTLVAHEEKSAFAQWVDRHWSKAAILAVVLAAVVLFIQWKNEQAAQEVQEQWSLFEGAGGPDEIAAILPQLEGKEAYAWGKLRLAQSLIQERRYDEAKAALADLAATGNAALTQEKVDLGAGERTLLEHAQATLAGQMEWEATYPTLFKNPDLPADAPRVTMVTTEGTIVIALYSDRAPKHAASFIAQCEAGAYDNTKFHQVFEGMAVMGGDPNTKEGDVSNWGQGGLDATVEDEDEETGLSHFKGVISAHRAPGAQLSSASQFAFLLNSFHGFDGNRTVFGEVVEGLDVVKRISESELEDLTQRRPADPVAITSTTVAK
jgi:cyclophilin family peptidyl-prolyl cis-trans isomerase